MTATDKFEKMIGRLEVIAEELESLDAHNKRVEELKDVIFDLVQVLHKINDEQERILFKLSDTYLCLERAVDKLDEIKDSLIKLIASRLDSLEKHISSDLNALDASIRKVEGQVSLLSQKTEHSLEHLSAKLDSLESMNNTLKKHMNIDRVLFLFAIALVYLLLK